MNTSINGLGKIQILLPVFVEENDKESGRGGDHDEDFRRVEPPRKLLLGNVVQNNVWQGWRYAAVWNALVHHRQRDGGHHHADAHYHKCWKKKNTHVRSLTWLSKCYHIF